MSKLLLRHGIAYSGSPAWNGIHETWLRRQQFSRRGIQLAFDADLEAMLFTLDRRDRLDKAIVEMATAGQYAAIVRRLDCLRGWTWDLRPRVAVGATRHRDARPGPTDASGRGIVRQRPRR